MTDVDVERDKVRAQSDARASAMLQNALRSNVLPRFYANSFIIANSDADIVTVFQANGLPVAILNMSYGVAKSIVNALNVSISDYEKKFNTEVPIAEIASITSTKTPG